MPHVWQQLKELYLYREMLRNLVAKELRARYKGSVLGFFWTFAHPLLMLTVYSVVFSFVMRVKVENYAMFLFAALLPWNYLAQSMIQSSGSFIHNAGLVKKIYFPRAVLPLSVVFANLINYCLGLCVLLPALLLFKIKLTAALLAFPVVLALQTLTPPSLASPARRSRSASPTSSPFLNWATSSTTRYALTSPGCTCVSASPSRSTWTQTSC